MTSRHSSIALARSFAWILAASFLLATLILLLLALNVTAPEPSFREDGTLVDNILVRFENEQARWPQELFSGLLFAAGFASVAGLGAVLRPLLGDDDTRARLVSVAFVVAGTLGLTAQLLLIGATEVAIDPHYCDCEFRSEELISRAQALDLFGSAAQFMTDGFAVVFAIGLLTLAGLAARGGQLPAGWVAYTRWFAWLALLLVVVGHALDSVFGALQIEGVDVGLISLVLVAIVAGVLTPIWAGWLARSLREEEPAPIPPD